MSQIKYFFEFFNEEQSVTIKCSKRDVLCLAELDN